MISAQWSGVVSGIKQEQRGQVEKATMVMSWIVNARFLAVLALWLYGLYSVSQSVHHFQAQTKIPQQLLG